MKHSPLHVLSLALAALAFAAGSPRLRAADFPQAESDLRPDPDLRTGQLPNGVKYMILVNHQPEDRASFRLVVDAGSFDEAADQQGLAHFLAHLAFHGSAQYAPGALFPILQKWGMSSDPEDNSQTDFEHTTYLLELPDTRASSLKEGFRIFADFAGGLLLRDDQIEPERSAIFTEKLQRASAAYRDQIAEMRFTLPDTLIPDRLPIGLGGVIGSSHSDRFFDFYNTWYRPERMTVIAVGDFDAATIEGMIKDSFEALSDRGPAKPEPKLGDIPIMNGLKTKFIAEPGSQSVRISLETVTPYSHEADTGRKRLLNLRRGLAFAMFNQRLAKQARRPDAPFASATADVGEQFDFVHNASLQLVCRPDQWEQALTAGELELRRALQYGFQPVELAGVVATMHRMLGQGVDAAGDRTSAHLADSLVHSLEEGQVFTSPAEDMAIFGPALDQVTVEECAAAFQEAWAAKGTYLFVVGDLALKSPDAELAAAYRASQAVAVEPLPKIVEEKFPYTDFGPAGEVKSQKEISDLGITEVVFANGVRLNLKPTHFDPGKVSVSVRIGGGGLTEPADAEPGLARFTEGVFTSAGLGRIGVGEIRRILAGKSAAVEFSVGEDAFAFRGTTYSADFPLELQLIAAYITDPGYRPEAMERARREIPEMYRNIAQIPDGILATTLARIMANGDPRFGLPAQSELAARNLTEMKAWLTPQFARGAIEVAMVGDFDPAAAIAAVARTFGALPKRDPKPPYTAERVISYPPKPLLKTYPATPGVTKGAILMIWPATDGRDVKAEHRFGLLAEIFSTRLRAKIHDPVSEATPPIARINLSATYLGFGTITVDVTTDPVKAIDNARSILQVAYGLAQKGVLDSEAGLAKQAALTAIDQSSRTNDYWLNSVLAEAQEYPQRLDWARNRSDDVSSVTAEELSSLAAQYLDPTEASRFLVLPEHLAPDEASPGPDAPR